MKQSRVLFPINLVLLFAAATQALRPVARMQRRAPVLQHRRHARVLLHRRDDHVHAALPRDRHHVKKNHLKATSINIQRTQSLLLRWIYHSLVAIQ